jgi:hypothetical protein
MPIPPSHLLLAALLLGASRSIDGQVVAPGSAGSSVEQSAAAVALPAGATDAPDRPALLATGGTRSAEPRHDIGLMIVARTTLVGLGVLGLLAYARRKRDLAGGPGNEHGLRLAPDSGRTAIADRMSRQRSRASFLPVEPGGGSIRIDPIERKPRASGRTVTATLDVDLTDATGQVVIRSGSIVELTVTETIQPIKTPTGHGLLSLDVTGVRVLGLPVSGAGDRDAGPRLVQRRRSGPDNTV